MNSNIGALVKEVKALKNASINNIGFCHCASDAVKEVFSCKRVFLNLNNGSGVQMLQLLSKHAFEDSIGFLPSTMSCIDQHMEINRKD